MQLMVVLRKHPPQQGSRVSEARTREVAVVALRWAGRLSFSERWWWGDDSSSGSSL